MLISFCPTRLISRKSVTASSNERCYEVTDWLDLRALINRPFEASTDTADSSVSWLNGNTQDPVPVEFDGAMRTV